MIFPFRLIYTSFRFTVRLLVPGYIRKKLFRATAGIAPNFMHFLSKINFIRIFLLASFALFFCAILLPLDGGFTSQILEVIRKKESIVTIALNNIALIASFGSVACCWACLFIKRKQKFNYINQSLETLYYFLLNCPYATKTEKINYCVMRKNKVESSFSLLQEIAINDRIRNGKNSKLYQLATKLISNFEYIEEPSRSFFVAPSFINDKSIILDQEALMAKKTEIRELCNLIQRHCAYLDF